MNTPKWIADVGQSVLTWANNLPAASQYIIVGGITVAACVALVFFFLT